MSVSNSKKDKWAALAVKAQAGDSRAYADLLRAIAPYIKNYVSPSLANPDWAEDVTQDVLISVHKSLKTYSAERPFKPWLHAIINFRRTDFLRRHYAGRADKTAPLENLDFEGEYVTKSPYAGELKDIEAALDALPEKQKKLFIMMKIEGYSAQEVADVMGMSISAVKVSVHRTAAKLKQDLE